MKVNSILSHDQPENYNQESQISRSDLKFLYNQKQTNSLKINQILQNCKQFQLNPFFYTQNKTRPRQRQKCSVSCSKKYYKKLQKQLSFEQSLKNIKYRYKTQIQANYNSNKISLNDLSRLGSSLQSRRNYSNISSKPKIQQQLTNLSVYKKQLQSDGQSMRRNPSSISKLVINIQKFNISRSQPLDIKHSVKRIYLPKILSKFKQFHSPRNASYSQKNSNNLQNQQTQKSLKQKKMVDNFFPSFFTLMKQKTNKQQMSRMQMQRKLLKQTLLKQKKILIEKRKLRRLQNINFKQITINRSCLNK